MSIQPNRYTRQVWKWTGTGWALLFTDQIETLAEPLGGYLLPIPSSKGPTAGTTIGGHGAPYLWEVWWEQIGTWGAEPSWHKRTEGGNWPH
jgi:hypothetical protein